VRASLALGVLIVYLVCVVSCLAQSASGTISGLVVDPTGAVIADADILVVNDATRVQYPGKTNSEGFYLIPNLPPGSYRLQVSRIGFKTLIKPDITVNVQDALSINFTLPLGAVSEIVTITAGVPLVNTQSATVGTVIDRNFVESLPLNGRSFNTLLQLTPGVVIAPSAANPSTPGQFNINGQRSDANYFVVDGVSANFGGTNPSSVSLPGNGGSGAAQAFNAYGGTSSLVSVDAVQEFRVQTSSFAPEFGRSPGGQVTIETRSGTNDFHGAAFDYLRNDAVDANDWFYNQAVGEAAAGTVIPKPALRQNDFGGTVGGPIVRDSTFLFFSYEGLRVRQPETARIPVPSVDLRSSALPSVAPFLNAYPVPNGIVSPDDSTAEFTGTYSNQITANATSIRLDHSFGDKFRLFGRYNYAPSRTLGRSFGDSLSELDTQKIDTQTLTVGGNAMFRTNLSASFRGNYSLQSGSSSSSLDNFGGAEVPNTSVLFPSPLSPRTSSADFSTVGLPPYFVGVGQKVQQYQANFVGDVNYSIGVHSLKFGVDFREVYLDLAGRDAGLTYLNFSLPQFASTGESSLFLNSERHPAKFKYPSLSFYAQDTWRLGRRLTATYGLRWEFSPPPTGRDGTTLASWTNTENIAAMNLAPSGTPLWKTRYDNFAPRVGLAYQLTPSGDFVLRGGWGMFYDTSSGTSADLGILFPNTATFEALNQAVPITDANAVAPSFSLTPPFPSFTKGFSSDLKSPVSYQWNVALEKSFGENQAVSITYVGQVGRNLLRLEELNQPNPNFAGIFYLTDNRDSSNFNALQIQYRRSLSAGFQALANYTWSHSIDTNSNDALPVIPGQLYSVNANRGSSDFDVRDSFSGALLWNAPSSSRRGFLGALARGWSLDTVVQARTAFPIDVVTNSVPLAGTSVATRPDLLPGVPVWLYGPQYPGGKALNLSAFALPQTPGQGTLGRNAFRGFGFTQMDLSVGRRFVFGDRVKLQFRLDVFNIFNHPNFANPDNNIDDGPLFFGLSSQMLNQSIGGLNALYQIGGPRSLQVSLKLIF
jgi:hypothetical protein